MVVTRARVIPVKVTCNTLNAGVWRPHLTWGVGGVSFAVERHRHVLVFPRRWSQVTAMVPRMDTRMMRVERALMSGVMPRLTDE